jgi:hypothetical protein
MACVRGDGGSLDHFALLIIQKERLMIHAWRVNAAATLPAHAPRLKAEQGGLSERQRQCTCQTTLASKKSNDDDDNEGLTVVDKFFEPLVEKFSELDDKDQASLAFIYQGVYFMVCIYVGVILVRAYKVFPLFTAWSCHGTARSLACTSLFTHQRASSQSLTRV